MKEYKLIVAKLKHILELNRKLNIYIFINYSFNIFILFPR